MVHYSNSINVSSQKHLNQIKHYDETMKRAHGYRHQHCDPELKKTTS